MKYGLHVNIVVWNLTHEKMTIATHAVKEIKIGLVAQRQSGTLLR